MGEQADMLIEDLYDLFLEDAREVGYPEPRLTPVLRALKHRAHLAFDRIWQSGRMSRSQAYEWLAGELGLSPEEAHMAVMDDEETLYRVIDASDRFMGVPLAADDFPDGD